MRSSWGLPFVPCSQPATEPGKRGSRPATWVWERPPVSRPPAGAWDSNPASRAGQEAHGVGIPRPRFASCAVPGPPGSLGPLLFLLEQSADGFADAVGRAGGIGPEALRKIRGLFAQVGDSAACGLDRLLLDRPQHGLG